MKRFDFNNSPDADERPLVEATQGRYVRYVEHVEKMNEALERAAVIAEGGLMGSGFRAAEIRALKVTP